MGSFSNPTPVQIGHGCQFLGDQWKIVGRMVLGVVEDGETYYWHEFHMKSPSGGEASDAERVDRRNANSTGVE